MSKTLGSILQTVGMVVSIFNPVIGAGLIAAGTITSALAPRPRQQVPTASIKSPTPPRVSAYGRVRLYWAYILYETAPNGWAVDVGAFHDGRLDAVETHYIGDKTVTVLSGGWIQKGPAGEWGNNDTVRVGVRLGLPTETAFSEVIAKLPGIWTSNHRGDGVATGFMLSKNVKTENFQTIYATGGPNSATLSIVARAQLVFDWRDGTQSVTDPSTWKWSENVWLQIAHYELVRAGAPPKLPPSNAGYAAELAAMYLSRWNRKIAPTLAYWTAAANDADIAMALKAGGTEPRYRSCLTHQHTTAHKDVRGALLACCDGWMSPRADRALIVYSGRYTAPTVTVGPDEILSYTLQNGVDEEDAINTIKSTYISAPHNFNAVDTDDWTDEDDIAVRGKVLAAEPQEYQVPSHAQARRLDKRLMSKVMAPQRGTTSTNAGGRSVIGQRYIRQQLIEAGTTFQNAVIEITKLTRNLQTGGVTYEWILADPNIDAWNPATEEGDPAPVGDRVAAEPLEAPEITDAQPNFASVTDAGTGVTITMTVAGLNRDDVTWFARWRIVGAAVWNEATYSDINPGPSVELESGFVATGATLEVEAAYGTGDGRVSPWSDPFEVSTSTDATVPDDAPVPELVSWGGSLNLQLSANIGRARSYRWNFYEGDGTTLIATHTTPDRSINYSAATAAADGIRRTYVVGVQGVNSAGNGVEAKTGMLSKPAPDAVTTPAIAGGAYTATATCDTATDVAGYVVFYSGTSGFDPVTEGSAPLTAGIPSITIYGLGAGTFYGRIAAFDAWTLNPAHLNLSSELTFAITTGGGSTPSGGGDDGGGFNGGGYLPSVPGGGPGS